MTDPVAIMTSRRALAVYVLPFSSRNSRPVARGVESEERTTLPTFAPDKTEMCQRRIASESRKGKGLANILVKFGLDFWYRYPRSTSSQLSALH